MYPLLTWNNKAHTCQHLENQSSDFGCKGCQRLWCARRIGACILVNDEAFFLFDEGWLGISHPNKFCIYWSTTQVIRLFFVFLVSLVGGLHPNTVTTNTIAISSPILPTIQLNTSRHYHYWRVVVVVAKLSSCSSQCLMTLACAVVLFMWYKSYLHKVALLCTKKFAVMPLLFTLVHCPLSCNLNRQVEYIWSNPIKKIPATTDVSKHHNYTLDSF